jgi:hypothetical protein
MPVWNGDPRKWRSQLLSPTRRSRSNRAMGLPMPRTIMTRPIGPRRARISGALRPIRPRVGPGRQSSISRTCPTNAVSTAWRTRPEPIRVDSVACQCFESNPIHQLQSIDSCQKARIAGLLRFQHPQGCPPNKHQQKQNKTNENDNKR